MVRSLAIFVLSALFPVFVSAQSAGGHIRRTVKKQQTAVGKPSEKKQNSTKKKQEKLVEQEAALIPVEAAGYDITISCNVPSATLYIDDNHTGTASGSRFLKTGSHTIKLDAEGYEPFSQTIQVNSSSRLFTFMMKKKEIPIVIQRLIDNMVYVKGGTFMMGASSEQGSGVDSDEKPVHQVILSSFSIGKYEVTQEEWEAVMGSNPSDFKGVKRPVEQVSWNDCHQFIRKLNAMTGKNFRLPTEAEWEYAARGGKKSRGYKYAGSHTLCDVGWYDDNSPSGTHDVGQLDPNELGLYDMSGNVWEWCSDRYGSYESGSQTNPSGSSSGSKRVIRGGGWYYPAWCCRVSIRNDIPPDDGYRTLGLRLAL